MKTKSGPAQKESLIINPDKVAVFDGILLNGYGIPYLLESREDTEERFGIKFKTYLHWHHFCWCLRNDWDVFSEEVIHNIEDAIRDLCEGGAKLRLPRGWTGKET